MRAVGEPVTDQVGGGKDPGSGADTAGGEVGFLGHAEQGGAGASADVDRFIGGQVGGRGQQELGAVQELVQGHIGDSGGAHKDLSTTKRTR